MTKVAVLTGGHKGIGLAITQALTDLCDYVIIGSRSATDETVQTSLTGSCGEKVIALTLDVRSSSSVTQFISEAAEIAGPVNILVNCAGVTTHQLVSNHTDEQWDSVIDTNLTGPFKMIRAVLPDMKKNSWGRIINIASTAAHTAVADHPAYCASKSGLLGLSRAVALEGAPHGVTSVTVSPTWVETDMLKSSAATIAIDQQLPVTRVMQELRDSNPQNRLVQPNEISALVAFLCTDAAAGLTMEDIQINAGAFW